VYGIPDVESFEATFHEKLKLKPQERWFTTLRLQCIVRHTLGKVTVYLRKKIGQSESSSSKVVGAYRKIEVTFYDQQLYISATTCRQQELGW